MELQLPDLLMKLDAFTATKPACFTKLVYESVVLTESEILQEQPTTKYITNYIL